MPTSPLLHQLPHDLAHPRRERASLIANVVTGASLLAVLGLLLAFWLLAPR
jgi:Sec-independent protein secretion pathway component TatC